MQSILFPRSFLKPVAGLLLAVVLLLGGCSSNEQLGPRPAMDLSTVVEAYLQLYQPGPLPRLFQTTYVYDRNGQVLAELFDEGRRTWASLDAISPHLIDATIATEDASFYTHAGVDPVRIAGAAWQNLEEGEIVSGASTITMQLARNLFLGPGARYDQTVDRKIQEAGLARELTDTYSKDEVLEMYLNLLNYGHLTYGPEAAARVYFGKSAADLNLAEATLLAGIPQQPANLDLFRNFALAKERQKVVLALMVRHGYLTLEEAQNVLVQPVALNPNPDRRVVQAPHFVQYVLAELESRLGEGYVRRAGLHIHTTLDLELQQIAQEIVTTKVAELQPRYDMNNGALVVLKSGTAEILAMVGSVDFDDESIDGQVNVATSPRQPGSAIKPVLYATAIDDLLISPATVIWDTPVTYTVGVGQTYRPLNYDRRFHGPVTARSALANSFNVPAVKLLDAVGVGHMLEKARAMGLHSLNRDTDWYGLSLTLGGGEVTLLDLSTAFHTIANGGNYVVPQSVLATVDSQGQSMADELLTPPQPVLSSATAFLLTDMLSDNSARTPMFGANSPLHLSRPAAAKTGTTDDNRDNWTVGFTRYLLVGVWTGNTDGRPMRGSTGASGAAPIWNAFMETVLNDPALLAKIDAPADPAQWAFAPAPDVVQRSECPPGGTCRAGGEYFSQAWLDAAGEAGPLADSVARMASAPVYADQGEADKRLMGYCGYPDGAVRSLLRLPGRLGLPTSVGAEETASLESDIDPFVSELSADKMRERAAALDWSQQVSGRVFLGPCDQLESLAANTQKRLLVDLANAGQIDVSDVAGDSATAIDSPVVTGDFHYGLAQPVVHDNNCPGGYIMGRVINQAGGPVAGVRIGLDDAWGNHYEAVSKSGVADYGHFDFPIYSSTPQTLTIRVLDGAGTPISPAVPVPHNVDEASNRPCHHVVLQGGE